MKFKECLIIGTGQLAIECARTLRQYELRVKVIDANPENSKNLESQILKLKAPYFHFNKKDLSNFLSETHETTLLVSAVNPIIIPEKILNTPYLESINLHHSLLPNHPGRNAEAWAIFDEDQEAGITWHKITPEIDSGKILIQKKIKLENHFTSLSLLKKQHQLAIEAFKEILPKLLVGEPIHSNTLNKPLGKMHYSWEVPNHGYINAAWSETKISAFLRALDYGILETLGKPKLKWINDVFCWRRYKIEKEKNMNFQNEVIFTETTIKIFKETTTFTLIDFYKV